MLCSWVLRMARSLSLETEVAVGPNVRVLDVGLYLQSIIANPCAVRRVCFFESPKHFVLFCGPVENGNR